MAQKIVALLVNGVCFGSFLVDAAAMPVLTEMYIKKSSAFALPEGKAAVAKELRDRWIELVKHHVFQVERRDKEYVYYTYYFAEEPCPGQGECDFASPYASAEFRSMGYCYRQYRLDYSGWVLEQRMTIKQVDSF